MLNFFPLLFLSGLFVPFWWPAAPPPPVGGTYEVSDNWTLVLRAEGKQVSGVLIDEEKYMAPATGTWINETTLALRWRFDAKGLLLEGEGELVFTPDGNSFSGTMRHKVKITQRQSANTRESMGDWKGKRTLRNSALPTIQNPSYFENRPGETVLPNTEEIEEQLPIPPPPPSRPPAGTEPGRMKGMTEAHNVWRKALGLPDLTWSDELARYAQEWAKELASRGCEMEHRPYSGPWMQLYGENIYASWGQQNTPADVVNNWAEERHSFDHNTLRCNGAWYECGHYTQVIWEDTREVGCAMVQCGDQELWICNYNPAGNVQGEKPYRKP
ncbi:MAG: hypothetical protein HC913_07690 [Microscillaceae bacterium]|nr:hypothetical protein [Microscillaceae bacterium]